jgi:hypothetical protein
MKAFGKNKINQTIVNGQCSLLAGSPWLRILPTFALVHALRSLEVKRLVTEVTTICH